ncbi:DNA repair protein rad52 [Puttea exsequens]|nr:DNA repair protein rad52 [Puttea exsequens]
MPGPGEQHKPSAATSNPFEEVRPHISEFTAQEIATISSRLEKQLGPEYLSSRPGAGGGKVHYLAADKSINLANEVFGFNGWSSSIQNVQIDFVDENQSTGKVSLGLSVIVRVTLKDGTYHEDIGYGHIENCKGKAPAFEKAKKEGTTDGLKRCFRNFGNILGNCVYDKDYVTKVTRLKIGPTKWDPDNLHRHPDYAPVKIEPEPDGLSRHPSLPQIKREWPTDADDTQCKAAVGEGDDEFGSDNFDEVDLSAPQGEDPDGVTLNAVIGSDHFRRRNSLPNKSHSASNRTSNLSNHQRPKSPLARNHATGPIPGPQTPMARNFSNMGPPVEADESSRIQAPIPKIIQQNALTSNGPQLPPHPGVPQAPQLPNAPQNMHSNETPSAESSSISDHEPPVGFFTARAAESLQSGPTSAIRAPIFNPHLESPSIRKTAGIDHSKTKPVGREIVGAPSAPQPAAPGPAMNRIIGNGNGAGSFVNPQADRARRVGMPGMVSPAANRGSYKPPQMKRAVDGTMRSALGDVTNASVNVAPDAGAGTDFKRQKVEVQNMAGNHDMLGI